MISSSTEVRVIALAAKFTDLAQRTAAARELAVEFGAHDLVVFVRDPENGVLLPAQGFRQTLPQGQPWRTFLAQAQEKGVARADLPFSSLETRTSATGIATADLAVFVLLGGAPSHDTVESARPLFLLLAVALRNENAAAAARQEAIAARSAAHQEQKLLAALDASRARATASAQEARRRATLASDVGVALTKSQPLRSSLQECAQALVKNLDAAFARLWTLNEEESVLELQASAGLYTHLDGPHGRVPVGSFKVGLIAQERKSHFTNDVVNDNRVSDREWAKREGMVSFAGYPLIVADRLVGVMALFARHALTDEILLTLGSVADAIAAGVERRRAEAKLAEESRIVETLHRIGISLSAELDLQKLVQQVTDEGTKLTRAAFGAFFYNVVNESGEAYLLYALSGAPREAFSHFPLPRPTGLFGPTFRGEGVIRLDDVQRDPRYGKNAPHHGMPAGHLPVRSYLAVPVISRSKAVLGGLFFGHPEVGVFTERDAMLVLGIAAQAAVGMDNARLFEEARRTASALREADRRKDEFLAMLAHELRNPLAPITTALELVLTRAGDRDDLARPLSVLRRQTHHLTKLVDDLLEVSRITSGKIRLEREALDAAVAVNRAIEISRPLIDAKKHDLSVSLPRESVLIDADPTRFAQVLGNLLNNAAKYTDEGGQIRIALSREGKEATFRVRDTGIGISKELLPRLFELFTQADTSLDRSQGGLGIGLTLVRSLVELHGGSVQAKSEGPGLGSEFVVRLPLAATQSVIGAEDLDQRPKMEPRRIVLVDDNVDAAETLAEFLADAGHEVRVAFDGPSSLEVVRAHKPDLVLLDIGLPRLDGYAVARELRREHGDTIILVALTGYGQEDDRRRSAEAGFDHHFVKPLHLDALAKLLSQSRKGLA